MKILYVLNSGKMGGMERHTLDLVRGLKDRGHDVYVWCNHGELSEEFKEAGGKVYEKQIRFDIDPLYVFSLFRFLKSESIDIVHSHELKASVNAMLSSYFSGTKIVTHTHTPISEWQIGEKSKKLNTHIYSFLVNNLSSREIALTESRKFIKQKEGIKEEKLSVIPNGTDIERFNIGEIQKRNFRHEILEKFSLPSNAFIFGNISRISREKGHDILVEAFGSFLKISDERKLDASNIFMIIAGGGELENEVRNKVVSMGLSDKVLFYGRFEDTDLAKIYSSFDIFVFPSHAEGFGLVLIEAMTAGVSVMCSDLDVLKEVGGSTITYFETGISQALAEKMYDLYMRYDRFEDLRLGAKKRVEELYTLEIFLDNYEGLYKEILGI